MTPNEPNNRRKFFRLAYPVELMPVLVWQENAYLVSEISEGGLRLKNPDGIKFKIGTTVHGEITFFSGERIEVLGTVCRQDPKEIVVSPLDGVDFRLILSEQQTVIREFPKVRRDDA